ncbi:MAG: AraC family transcriptional regulator [Bacteroidota bacterium]
MLFNLGYQSVILLIIFLQLVLFSILLFVRGRDSKANIWLGVFILLSAFYITPWMLGHAGWYAHDGYREFLFFIPFHQLFLFGPVIYFFTKRLTKSITQLSSKDVLHFIPAGLYMIYALVVFIYDVFLVDEFYFYADGQDKDLDLWYQIAGLISMLTYSVVCLRLYAGYKRHIFETVSYADSLIANWLRNFLIVFIAILLFRTIFIVIFPELGDWGMKWWFYVLFGLLAAYLAIAGYANSLRLSTLSFLKQPELTEVSAPRLENTSSLNQEDVDEILKKIHRLFENHSNFKDPELSLSQLAQSINTNTSILSKAINSGSQMNFNDFVNSFRVEAVKESLKKGEHKTTTLVGIAMDCGFNSKSTFIRSFKKQTGMTPTEYVKSIS